MIPTLEQLLDLFAVYNARIWPMQIVAYLLGIAGFVLAFRRGNLSNRLIPAILAFFWLWVAFVFWLPNALAVAFLLRFRVPQEAFFLAAMYAGNLLANFYAGDSAFTAGTLALANSVEILLAITLVRRWCGPRPDMSDTRDLAYFMVAAGLIAPMCSALVASVALLASDGLSPTAVLRWAGSDALAMLILAPGAFVLCGDRFFSRKDGAAGQYDYECGRAQQSL